MGHDAHGHGDAHAASAAEPHGPAELPPEPASRSITPAVADYEERFPGAGLLWPLVWLVFAVVLWQGASRWNGGVLTHHEGAVGHEGGESHEAAPHGE